VSHAHVALAPVQRLRIGRLIVDDGWPVARVSMGRDGTVDRSWCPHRSPTKTPPDMVREVVHLRWKKRLGPVAIGARLEMPASTVHAVLTCCRLNQLPHVDLRARGAHPPLRTRRTGGEMIHDNVKKSGNIPDGGGWRFVGRQRRGAQPGRNTRQAAQLQPRSSDGHGVRPHRYRRSLPGPVSGFTATRSRDSRRCPKTSHVPGRRSRRCRRTRPFR
jgi:hypothetical protein